MTRYRYESFAGFRLLVHHNELTDEGEIIRVKYSRDGTVVTFTTVTGKHSFYYEKSAIQLTDGKWKFPGDFQHWAYVVDQETYQHMVSNHEVEPRE